MAISFQSGSYTYSLYLHSNDVDLRMVAEMGVKPYDSSESTQATRRRFKCAIATVMATVRMRRMACEWKKTKELGEDLKRAKNEVLKRRNT